MLLEGRNDRFLHFCICNSMWAHGKQGGNFYFLLFVYNYLFQAIFPYVKLLTCPGVSLSDPNKITTHLDEFLSHLHKKFLCYTLYLDWIWQFVNKIQIKEFFRSLFKKSPTRVFNVFEQDLNHLDKSAICMDTKIIIQYFASCPL